MQKPFGLGFRIVMVLALFGVAACGSSSTPTPDTCATPTVDVTGAWAITGMDMSSDPSCTGSFSYTLNATQSGSSVTVTDTDGRNYGGQICGNQVTATVPFSFPEDGGTTTVTALMFTVTGSSLSGSSSWSWTDGSDSCSGTSTYSGTK